MNLRHRALGMLLVGGVLAGPAAPAADKPAFWTYRDFLDGKTPQTYTIRRDHPRLLITRENRREIVEKIKATTKTLGAMFEAHVEWEALSPRELYRWPDTGDAFIVKF